jgi:hypothetical protein
MRLEYGLKITSYALSAPPLSDVVLVQVQAPERYYGSSPSEATRCMHAVEKVGFFSLLRIGVTLSQPNTYRSYRFPEPFLRHTPGYSP